MSRSTPPLRNFAKHVLAHESRTNRRIAEEASVAFHAIDRLRPQLENLMGSGGFRALLLRSLALAKAEVPWLRAAQVNGDGSLEGLEKIHAQRGPIDSLEAQVVLLAQLLGLMVTFIGERLTMRLVQEAWPTIPDVNLGLGNGGRNAKERPFRQTR